MKLSRPINFFRTTQLLPQPNPGEPIYHTASVNKFQRVARPHVNHKKRNPIKKPRRP